MSHSKWDIVKDGDVATKTNISALLRLGSSELRFPSNVNYLKLYLNLILNVVTVVNVLIVIVFSLIFNKINIYPHNDNHILNSKVSFNIKKND